MCSAARRSCIEGLTGAGVLRTERLLGAGVFRKLPPGAGVFRTFRLPGTGVLRIVWLPGSGVLFRPLLSMVEDGRSLFSSGRKEPASGINSTCLGGGAGLSKALIGATGLGAGAGVVAIGFGSGCEGTL